MAIKMESQRAFTGSSSNSLLRTHTHTYFKHIFTKPQKQTPHKNKQIKTFQL